MVTREFWRIVDLEPIQCTYDTVILPCKPFVTCTITHAYGIHHVVLVSNLLSRLT